MNEWNGPLPRARDRVTLKKLNQMHIRWLMEETQCQKDTAEIIGIKPGSLSRKISREKIEWTKNKRPRQEMDESSARHTWAGMDRSDDAETSTDD